MTKHYVKFFYPGIMVPETSYEAIESRDKTPKVLENAYAYQFFDREEIVSGGDLCCGKPKNESGMFYVGGRVKTFEEVEHEMPVSILSSNMRINKIEKVVMTRFRQAMQLNRGDVVL